MISAILQFVYFVSGAVAIASGAWVQFGVVQGKLFRKWALVFFKSALVACVTGLLLHFPHLHPADWVALVTVYVSAVAVLAWRRFLLAGVWALLFALSAMAVWCLNLFVVLAHVFEMLIPTQFRLFHLAESAVLLLFVALGGLIVKRYRETADGPVMHS
jgi:hypothetical protein